MKRTLTILIIAAAGIALASLAQWVAFHDHYFAAREYATGGFKTNYVENGTNFTAHIFTNSDTFTVLRGGVK